MGRGNHARIPLGRRIRYRIAKWIYPEIFTLVRQMFEDVAEMIGQPRADAKVIVVNEEGARLFRLSGGGGQSTDLVQ